MSAATSATQFGKSELELATGTSTATVRKAAPNTKAKKVVARLNTRAPASTAPAVLAAEEVAAAPASTSPVTPLVRRTPLGAAAVDLPHGPVDVDAIAAIIAKADFAVGADQFRKLYACPGGRTLGQIDDLVGELEATVQLQMLHDLQGFPTAQLQAPRPEQLQPEYRADLELRDAGARRTWMGSLSCIRTVIPHVIAKTPAKEDAEARAAWASYSPFGEDFDKNRYVFLGQFPMALSAQQIATIFFEVTGITPLRVDHLPKGAKVFLRDDAEVASAAMFNQTVQVCEYGTLIGKATSEAEALATRAQLLTARRLVDEAYRRAANPARRNPYVLAHATVAQAKRAEAASAKKSKAPTAADCLVRHDQATPFKMARNGTYPMTFEAPATKTA